MEAYLCDITVHVRKRVGPGALPDHDAMRQFDKDAVEFVKKSLIKGGFVSGDRLRFEVDPLTCADGLIQVSVKIGSAP